MNQLDGSYFGQIYSILMTQMLHPHPLVLKQAFSSDFVFDNDFVATQFVASSEISIEILEQIWRAEFLKHKTRVDFEFIYAAWK